MKFSSTKVKNLGLELLPRTIKNYIENNSKDTLLLVTVDMGERDS